MIQLIDNWMEVSVEAGLNLWERQPSEIDREWRVWRYYMDSYPFVEKPTFAKVAEDLELTVVEVRQIYLRWEYDTRLQAWAKHIDTDMLVSRKKALVEMNEKHISMACKVTEKLQTAIDNVDPYDLKIADIKGLMQIATDLERKARLDVIEVESTTPKDMTVTTPEEKSVVPKEDMKEVLEILLKAGVLKGNIGVRQTTEVICKND